MAKETVQQIVERRIRELHREGILNDFEIAESIGTRGLEFKKLARQLLEKRPQ